MPSPAAIALSAACSLTAAFPVCEELVTGWGTGTAAEPSARHGGGDNWLDGVPVKPYAPADVDALVDHICTFFGVKAAEEFHGAYLNGKFGLVNTGDRDGAADATTIGVTCNWGPLESAVIAMHEFTHWKRASAQIPGPGGVLVPPPPDGHDPVAGGSPAQNPCGAYEHAKMGICDLDKCREQCEEDADVACEEYRSLKDDWQRRLWKIQDQIGAANDWDCRAARRGNQPKSVWDVARELRKDVTEPHRQDCE